jgi:hypothetical protein
MIFLMVQKVEGEQEHEHSEHLPCLVYVHSVVFLEPIQLEVKCKDEPADGQPVNVQVDIEVSFRLH